MNEFKKISDVDVINSLTDNDNVVIIGSDGVIRQTSSSNLGMDITKTEVVETLAEGDKLVVVSNGEVKQLPTESFTSGAGDYVVTLTEDNFGEVNYMKQCFDNYDPIYDVLMTGGSVWLDFTELYGALSRYMVFGCELTSSGLFLYNMDEQILFPNGSHNLPEAPAN